MAEGYIKLYRKLLEHPIWQDKPFSRGQAWIDLLFMSSHTDARFYSGGAVITAQAGQVVTSEVKLAERWGWSRQKVRDFLAMLAADNMAVKTPGRSRTVITLCNYSDYNESAGGVKNALQALDYR